MLSPITIVAYLGENCNLVGISFLGNFSAPRPRPPIFSKIKEIHNPTADILYNSIKILNFSKSAKTVLIFLKNFVIM